MPKPKAGEGKGLVSKNAGSKTKDRLQQNRGIVGDRAKQDRAAKLRADRELSEFNRTLENSERKIKEIASGAYNIIDFDKLSPMQRRLLYLNIVLIAASAIASNKMSENKPPRAKDKDASKDNSTKANFAHSNSSAASASVKLTPQLLQQINTNATAAEMARIADPKFLQDISVDISRNLTALNEARAAGMGSDNPYIKALEANSTSLIERNATQLPEGMLGRAVDAVTGGTTYVIKVVNQWFKDHDPFPDFPTAFAGPDDQNPTSRPNTTAAIPTTGANTTTTTTFNPTTRANTTTTTFAPVTNSTTTGQNTTTTTTTAKVVTTTTPATPTTPSTTITTTNTTTTVNATTPTTSTTTTTTTSATTTTPAPTNSTTYSPTTTSTETTTSTTTTIPETTTPTTTTNSTTTTSGVIADPTGSTYTVKSNNQSSTSTSAPTTSRVETTVTSTTKPTTKINVNITTTGGSVTVTAITETPTGTTTSTAKGSKGNEAGLVAGLVVGVAGLAVVAVVTAVCYNRRKNPRNRRRRAEVDPKAVPNTFPMTTNPVHRATQPDNGAGAAAPAEPTNKVAGGAAPAKPTHKVAGAAAPAEPTNKVAGGAELDYLVPVAGGDGYYAVPVDLAKRGAAPAKPTYNWDPKLYETGGAAPAKPTYNWDPSFYETGGAAPAEPTHKVAGGAELDYLVPVAGGDGYYAVPADLAKRGAAPAKPTYNWDPDLYATGGAALGGDDYDLADGYLEDKDGDDNQLPGKPQASQSGPVYSGEYYDVAGNEDDDDLVHDYDNPLPGELQARAIYEEPNKAQQKPPSKEDDSDSGKFGFEEDRKPSSATTVRPSVQATDKAPPLPPRPPATKLAQGQDGGRAGGTHA